MEWHRLRVFYYVAKAQSISRAAMELNTAQPSITRTIQQLEYQAKSKLFIRHPRGLILTKQGEILFHHVKNFVAELEQAKNEMSGLSGKTSGSLRITTTYGFASTLLFNHLGDFSKIHPYITLHLICNDTNLDLTKREADISIRPFDTNTKELEQIFLYKRTTNLYASPTYLQEMGIPKKPEDLDHHRLIVFENPNNVTPYAHTTWNLTLGMKNGQIREPFMTVNSVECLFQAAEKGLGIIMLSEDSSLLNQNRLEKVLPQIKGPESDIYYIYPKSIKNITTVHVLKEYLLKALHKN